MQQVNSLDKYEKLYLLEILKEKNIEHTKNANGYFFNMNKIPQSERASIMESLNYILQNKNVAMQREMKRKSELDKYRNMVIDTLQTSKHKVNEDYLDKITIEPVGNICLEVRVPVRTYKDPDTLIAKYNEERLAFIKQHKLYHMLYVKASKKAVNKPDVYGGIDDEEYEDVDDTFIDSTEIDLDVDDIENVFDDVPDSETESIPESEESDTEETFLVHQDYSRLMTFYRELLEERGYEFSKRNHDTLCIQEYLDE